MPVGVQCPISSSLGEFPSYGEAIGSGVLWAFTGIGVHRPSFRFPYLVFSTRSYQPLDFNRVSSLRRRIATNSVDPSLTHFLGDFPGLGLHGSGTRCCGPRGGTAVRMEQKIRSKFLPWPE